MTGCLARRAVMALAFLYLLAAIVLSAQYQYVLTHQILGAGFVLAVGMNRETRPIPQGVTG